MIVKKAAAVKPFAIKKVNFFTDFAPLPQRTAVLYKEKSVRGLVPPLGI